MASGKKIVPVHAHPGLPTRLELTRLMEEQTVEELSALTKGGGAAKLCEMLGTDPENGLANPVPDFRTRCEIFGENKFEERKLTPYWRYCLDQLKEKIIILLLSMATIELVVKSIWGKDQEEKTESIAESCVLYATVSIIVNVAAFLDWKRERMFEALTKRLALSNKRFVIRDGKQLELTDQDICVGDVVSFNSHMAAIISCDGIFLSGKDVKTDESALTGEPEPITKNHEHPFMISGTTVNAGSGTMLVVAVGDNSIAGKIKKNVYGQDEAEPSPLYAKLHKMADDVGKMGVVAASTAFVAMCAWGYVHGANPAELLDIFLVTLGVLACAIPEGLPLALVIALALTSNKMTKENNLVKTLNSCETMGSATTICTDKTGTLTTNRMTVRGACFCDSDVSVGVGGSVGRSLAEDQTTDPELKKLLAHACCVCTMNESGIRYEEGSTVPIFQGNPTECALLKMAEEMAYDYKAIRAEVVGRSPSTLDRGSAKTFTSARKMMSWTVERPEGGYRVYAKGASEIVLSRCTHFHKGGSVLPLEQVDATRITEQVISRFADQAMRTIGVAYKDLDTFNPDELCPTTTNSDGTPAFVCETGLTLMAILGIEDPLRPEVAPAIAKCYKAGIDVRMVTGDNLQTAIAIAKGAGILNLELHCDKMGKPLPRRAMEGKDFRRYVHDTNAEGEAVFNQSKFDEIWPYLRVLARSSPDDKLTLAKGLNGSQIFKDKKRCEELLRDDRIVVFPDRQVVAMTGDGTNDAPALKASDVGFAMGIAGTQIAKDAANIILLDDNFASIVVAAKWGRNVFDSIQKFLQFQLTVNVSILIINVICAVADKKSPLTVLHLLWLNLIMDSAASIALASEPPTDALLDRPPVNRNDSIITGRMFLNIGGMACYEIGLMMGLLWHFEWIPELEAFEGDFLTGKKSRHYTMLFNIFVLLQVFNEYNARFLQGGWQLWRGLVQNPLFLIISVGTMLIQVVLVQIAAPVMSYPLKIHNQGLTVAQWFICIGFGAGTLVVQQVLNLIYTAVERLWGEFGGRLHPAAKKV